MKILLVIILSICGAVGGTIIVPYITPSSCLENQYFQYSSLQCVECGVDQIVSTDKLSCACDNGFRYSENTGGPTVRCQACGVREVVSLDGWNCVKCAASTPFDVVTKMCRGSCAAGQVNVDRREDGSFYANNQQQCISCGRKAQPGTSERICKHCDQNTLRVTRTLDSGESCRCPVGLARSGGTSVTVTLENGICFSSGLTTTLTDARSTFTVAYPGAGTIPSAYFREFLVASQALCSQNQNFTACQLLGNLCVLYMYNEDNQRLSVTDACKEYLAIVESFTGDFVGRLADWPSTMPWLYYKASSTVEVLDKTEISVKFSRREVMKFVLVKYAANGSFLEILDDPSEIDMCYVSEDISSKAYLFTTSYHSTCNIKIGKLVKKSQTVFYDMYLKLNDKDLYPVPVLVQNLRFNGENVNQNSDRTQWRLNRRFFLVDNVSGRQGDENVEIIQYAQSIEISYRLRDDGLIYPPLLKIDYAAISVVNQDVNSVSVAFKVSYEMNTDSIKRNVEIAVGVLSVLGIIYAGIGIVSWRRRQGVLMLDCSSLIVFVIYIFNVLPFVFFAVLFATCIQWLFFFKQQTTVIRILPVGEQQQILKGLFVSAFVMKFIDVIYVLYHQIYVDIFFIDWERPRGAVSINTDGQNKNINIPVSVMRTLFVANEWREIQTIRRVKPTLQFLVVLFFFKVVGFEYWTTTDPLNRLSVDKSSDYVGDYNFCLRFAVLCLLFVVIAVVQWLIFGFIYERFIGDAVGDFVDFCSMSNISVFLMSHKQFGYYIHGRSVHGRSDTSLLELYEQFQREENNLCGRRGLEANSDLQTFEMSLTTKFRNEYAKIVQPLLSRDMQQNRRGQMPARQNPVLPGTSLPPGLEKSVTAYGTMNRYLSSFIEHALRDNDYIVRDKYLLERLLQNELQPPLDKCIFYNDDRNLFTCMLLYGQEWSILLFEMLFFVMIDWIFSWNSVLAAVVTYFIDLLIVTLRDSLGKKNLAAKTLVDERFLI